MDELVKVSVPPASEKAPLMGVADAIVTAPNTKAEKTARCFNIGNLREINWMRETPHL
jgi:hypothetical protein